MTILGYKRPPGEDNYWFGNVEGADRKFIRVIASVSLPIIDRSLGAVVVIGELYWAGGPPDFWGIDAAVGAWPELESALTRFRKDLKFDHVIVDTEYGRNLMYRMPGINYALNEIPLASYVAPPQSFTEIGRAKVDQMLADGRLHADAIMPILDMTPDEGARSLKAAICWMSEFPAQYVPVRMVQRRMGRILGIEGL